MGATLAAAYLGISPSKLAVDVKAHRKPEPVTDGRLRLWLKVDLDRWLEREHGIVHHVPGDKISGRIDDIAKRRQAGKGARR